MSSVILSSGDILSDWLEDGIGCVCVGKGICVLCRGVGEESSSFGVSGFFSVFGGDRWGPGI